MGGVCSREGTDESGAVGDCGGVGMAKKQSLSYVILREFIAVSATFMNDASYVRLQLSFNKTSLLCLKKWIIIIIMIIHFIFTSCSQDNYKPEV